MTKLYSSNQLKEIYQKERQKNLKIKSMSYVLKLAMLVQVIGYYQVKNEWLLISTCITAAIVMTMSPAFKMTARKNIKRLNYRYKYFVKKHEESDDYFWINFDEPDKARYRMVEIDTQKKIQKQYAIRQAFPVQNVLGGGATLMLTLLVFQVSLGMIFYSLIQLSFSDLFVWTVFGMIGFFLAKLCSDYFSEQESKLNEDFKEYLEEDIAGDGYMFSWKIVISEESNEIPSTEEDWADF